MTTERRQVKASYRRGQHVTGPSSWFSKCRLLTYACVRSSEIIQLRGIVEDAARKFCSANTISLACCLGYNTSFESPEVRSLLLLHAALRSSRDNKKSRTSGIILYMIRALEAETEQLHSSRNLTSNVITDTASHVHVENAPLRREEVNNQSAAMNAKADKIVAARLMTCSIDNLSSPGAAPQYRGIP